MDKYEKKYVITIHGLFVQKGYKSGYSDGEYLVDGEWVNEKYVFEDIDSAREYLEKKYIQETSDYFFSLSRLEDYKGQYGFE